jgi:hypothetical protein
VQSTISLEGARLRDVPSGRPEGNEEPEEVRTFLVTMPNKVTHTFITSTKAEKEVRSLTPPF